MPMKHAEGVSGPAEVPATISRKVRHAAGYHALLVLVRLAAVLPRPLAQSVFAGVGLVAWATFTRDRQRIAAHLALAVPGLGAVERARFVRRFFVDAARNLADAMRFLGRPGHDLLTLVDVEGEEHLTTPLRDGRGIVAVTGHIGAWELLGGYLVQRGIPVTVIARPLKDLRFEAMIGTLRRRLGVRVVHETGDLRGVFRALRRGEVLGLLIDQGRRWPGLCVPFFGRPAHVTTAPAEIARRTGAALIPMSIRQHGLRHRITVLPAVDVDWERPGAIAAATATLARAVESLIWRCPTQWAWTYGLWSTGAGSAAANPGGGNEEPGGDVMGATSGCERPHAAGALAGAAVPVAALLVATALASGGLGCGSGAERPASPPARSAPAGEAMPSQELSDFVLRETNEEGRLTWIFRAAEARIYEARDEIAARGIHIDFFDASGRVTSVLSADRAVIERRTNDMQAAGNVVVRNSEGHELHTEELQYSSQRDKIFTDEFVRVLRGRDVLTGYGLETDPDLEGGQFEIQREFEATVRDEAVPEVGGGAGGGASGDPGGGAGGEDQRGTP